MKVDELNLKFWKLWNKLIVTFFMQRCLNCQYRRVTVCRGINSNLFGLSQPSVISQFNLNPDQRLEYSRCPISLC